MLGSQVGPYKLVAKLGQGGMGSVWRGEHALLKRVRAIKILDAELTQNQALVERFMNEAIATSQLQHPNLVDVFHVDRTPWGGYYIELEYLEGTTLSHYLASHVGPVPPHKVVAVVGPIAHCMVRMHERGIVHRDLKPENVFLAKHTKLEFLVKVLDLGVAQLARNLVMGPATKAGTVIGTTCYMAPEQLRGEHVTGAADTYALGVIAYQMLTGNRLPYQLDHESLANYFALRPQDMYERHRSMEPIAPRLRVPALRDPLGRVVMQMIDVDPTRRPATIAAAAVMLAEAVTSDGPSPDGIAVLREVAPEIVPRDTRDDTHRSGPPAQVASASGSGSKYKIVEKLGAGGMAEVFSADAQGEAGFSRRVALKRVLAGFSEQPQFAAMFIAEARLASAMNHPNVVAVLDFAKGDDGRLFLVMEYIHGRDLSAVLEAGPLSPPLIIYLLVEMLRGLGYAHDFADPDGTVRGLVHRDVSPHNVMVSYEGAVKLNDFGLAKAKSASGNARSATAKGKVSYMSPEQANGDSIDGRSDLFAVGVMLWEMLAHESLFVGTPSECIAQLMFKEIPPPSSKRSRVPADLERIAMRLLERDRANRYPTAEAVVDDLLRCRDAARDARGDLARLLAQRFPDIAVRSRPGVSDQSVPHALQAKQIAVPIPLTTLTGAASQVSGRPGTRRRWRAAAGVVAAAAVLTVVAIVIVSRRDETPPRPASDVAMTTPPAADAAVNRPDDRTVAGSVLDASPDGSTTDAAALVAPPDAATVVASADAGVSEKPPIRPSIRKPPVSENTVPKGTGEVSIFVNPWAVISLDGKELGQTPWTGKLAAGKHRVRISNEDLGKDETLTITVSPDNKTTIQRTW